MEWKAAAVRGRLPEQGDSGHITHGVEGCSCPGRLPEQGDSGH